MSCSACCCSFEDNEDFLRCMVELCGKTYHILCTNGKHLTSEERKCWVCPECRNAMKRGGDNSLTPVGLTKKVRDPNVTFRKKLPPQMMQQSDEPNELSIEIINLRSDMATLRDQLTHAVSLIASYDAKLDKYAQQVATLNTKLEEYEKRTPEMHPVTSPLSTTRDAPAPKIPELMTKPSRLDRPKEQSGPKVRRSPLNKAPISVAPDSAVVAVKDGHSSLNDFPFSSTVRITDGNDLPIPTDQQWTEVKRRRSRGPTSLCGAAGPAITTLRAVEPVKYLHLWNMASSADDILQYLKKLCPTGSCTVEELSPRGSYKSYKIGVPEAQYDTCYSIDVWPVNARIKAWINYRKPTGQVKVNTVATTTNDTTRQRPFRGTSSAQ